jgi:DNA mismatch repair protein MutH
MTNYDSLTPKGILKKALELKDKSLRDLYPEYVNTYKGKGKLGQLVEKLHFKYEPNSASRADFEKAGVELKTSPIKQDKKGRYSAKERISLSNIDFSKLILEESFDKSSLIEKNRLLLLMFYLYNVGLVDMERIFKIIKLWKIPNTDIKIIKHDWETIKNKVRLGKAHEISGRDTVYLEASTTGQGKGMDYVTQPNSEIKAKRRRFAFKNSYVSTIISSELDNLESMLPDDFDIETVSIEEYVQSRFEKYYGNTQAQLKKRLGVEYSERTKQGRYLLAKAILGVNLNSATKIEEFEKAGIQIKTVTLDLRGVPKESTSFKQIDYEEVIKEESFPKSFLYNEIVSRKYLFVIFKENAKGEKVLLKAKLWAMDTKAEDTAEQFWLDIKSKVAKSDFKNFWKISDKRIFHVRPKAVDSKDLKTLSSGLKVPKLAYWINWDYVLDNIVREN